MADVLGTLHIFIVIDKLDGSFTAMSNRRPIKKRVSALTINYLLLICLSMFVSDLTKDLLLVSFFKCPTFR